MQKDKLVEEIRIRANKLWKKYNFNLNKICTHLKKKEQKNKKFIKSS